MNWGLNIWWKAWSNLLRSCRVVVGNAKKWEFHCFRLMCLLSTQPVFIYLFKYTLHPPLLVVWNDFSNGTLYQPIAEDSAVWKTLNTERNLNVPNYCSHTNSFTVKRWTFFCMRFKLPRMCISFTHSLWANESKSITKSDNLLEVPANSLWF